MLCLLVKDSLSIYWYLSLIKFNFQPALVCFNPADLGAVLQKAYPATWILLIFAFGFLLFAPLSLGCRVLFVACVGVWLLGGQPLNVSRPCCVVVAPLSH